MVRGGLGWDRFVRACVAWREQASDGAPEAREALPLPAARTLGALTLLAIGCMSDETPCHAGLAAMGRLHCEKGGKEAACKPHQCHHHHQQQQLHWPQLPWPTHRLHGDGRQPQHKRGALPPRALQLRRGRLLRRAGRLFQLAQPRLQRARLGLGLGAVLLKAGVLNKVARKRGIWAARGQGACACVGWRKGGRGWER